MYEVENQQAADDARELLGARLPNNDSARDEDPDDIGNRDFDRMYDWSVHVSIAIQILPPITEMG